MTDTLAIPPADNPLIIGVTGKAGSGFNTDVADILASYGFHILQSDDVVDHIWKFPEVLVDVARVFGRETIFNNPEEPDPRKWVRKRGALGELVANDYAKQRLLNSILEPYIFVCLYNRIKELRSQGASLIALISPRLAKSYTFLFCSSNWYVFRRSPKRRQELIRFYESRGFDPEYVSAKVNRTLRMQRDVLEPEEFQYDVVVGHPESVPRLRSVIGRNLDSLLAAHNELREAGVRVLRAYKRRGQFIRSALSLSQLTGSPVLIKNITSFIRKTKIIQPNLVACAHACARVCGGQTVFDTDDRFLDYVPGKLVPSGSYTIGMPPLTTISPMVQTLLPLSLFGRGRVDFVLEGCTELNFSAPISYFEHVFFPLLRRFGAKVSVEVVSRGYLQGPQGKIHIRIEQVDRLAPINLPRKGAARKVIFARNSIGFEPSLDLEFAEEMEDFVRSLGFEGEFERRFDTRAGARGKGVSMSVALETEFSHLGADAACDENPSLDGQRDAFRKLKERTRFILTSDAALDPFCADQILIYLAIAGGCVTIPTHPHMDHFYTQILLLNSFSGRMFSIERQGRTLRVDAGPTEGEDG